MTLSLPAVVTTAASGSGKNHRKLDSCEIFVVRSFLGLGILSIDPGFSRLIANSFFFFSSYE